MSGKSDFKRCGELVIHLKFSYSNILIVEKYCKFSGKIRWKFSGKI